MCVSVKDSEAVGIASCRDGLGGLGLLMASLSSAVVWMEDRRFDVRDRSEQRHSPAFRRSVMRDIVLERAARAAATSRSELLGIEPRMRSSLTAGLGMGMLFSTTHWGHVLHSLPANGMEQLGENVDAPSGAAYQAVGKYWESRQ